MNYDEYEARCNAVGMSPAKVAGLAGLSRSFISKWKTGERKATVHSTEVLEAALQQLESVDILRNNSSTFHQPFINSATTNDIPILDLQPDVGVQKRTAFGMDFGNIYTMPITKITYHAPDNAMLLEGIPKGATLTLEQTNPIDGRIVLVSLSGEHYLRRFSRMGQVILLTCSNPKYEPLATTIEELEQNGNGVIGVVTHVSFDV